jgi:ABC-type dipeptide/oligopeptide/nickel transport system permease component
VSKYLFRRILALIPVAIGVVTLTFAMIHLVPGDPVTAMLGDYAAPADIVQMRHVLRLDQPLWRQYAELLAALRTAIWANRFRNISR